MFHRDQGNEVSSAIGHIISSCIRTDIIHGGSFSFYSILFWFFQNESLTENDESDERTGIGRAFFCVYVCACTYTFHSLSEVRIPKRGRDRWVMEIIDRYRFVLRMTVAEDRGRVTKTEWAKGREPSVKVALWQNTHAVCMVLLWIWGHWKTFLFPFMSSSPETSILWMELQRSYGGSWRKSWNSLEKSLAAMHGTMEPFQDR